MGAIVVYEPIILNITADDFSSGNVLNIENQFGRDVNIQVSIDDEIVDSEIVSDENDITITFYEESVAVIPTGNIKVVIS